MQYAVKLDRLIHNVPVHVFDILTHACWNEFDARVFVLKNDK